MTSDQREIRRKLRILEHAEEIGDVSQTCRYFGIGRASFYKWRKAYQDRGEAGLINAKPIPKCHARRHIGNVIDHRLVRPAIRYKSPSHWVAFIDSTGCPGTTAFS